MIIPKLCHSQNPHTCCNTYPGPGKPTYTEALLVTIVRENPAYGINAQVAQCAFLVPRVKNCQTSDFVISMSNNPSTNCYRWLRRLNVSFKGEISRDLQAFRTT